jgi:hypothetical protein
MTTPKLLIHEQVTISYGIEPSSGKWKAQMNLPDGSVRSTAEGYDTLEELRSVVEQWMTANGIEFQRAN